jgi:hypothetical protein
VSAFNERVLLNQLEDDTMNELRVYFDGDCMFCTGLWIADHINDGSRSLIEVDPEYADPDGTVLFWVNNEYLYPESELEPEEV